MPLTKEHQVKLVKDTIEKAKLSSKYIRTRSSKVFRIESTRSKSSFVYNGNKY